jgi:prephenate dehydrogenase
MDRLFAFVKGLGARPSTLDPADHDRMMAFLSHLPQLTASAMMDAIGEAVAGNGLTLAGRGLVDTTRLASSPAETWVDICATNADVIKDALDSLIGRRIFAAAAHWRTELMKGRE